MKVRERIAQIKHISYKFMCVMATCNFAKEDTSIPLVYNAQIDFLLYD